MERRDPIKEICQIPQNNEQCKEIEQKAEIQQINQIGDIMKINEMSEKKVKKRKKWNQEFQLLDVTYPLKVRNPKITKKYGLTIKYLNDDGQIRKKKILFGSKGRQDYIDNLNEFIRLKKARYKYIEDKFHPNHWTYYLLNTQRQIGQSYLNYLQRNDIE